jgi:hypothetical protein
MMVGRVSTTRGTSESREAGIGTAMGALAFLVVILVIAGSDVVRRVDFSAFYTTALIERQGHSAKIYDLAERTATQKAFLGGTGMVVNPYPPFQALLFAPLGGLTYRVAYVAWGVINILFWLTFQYLLRNEPRVRSEPLRYLALNTLFFPIWVAILQGQFSILLLFSFALSFSMVKRGRQGLAGLALGPGLLKFQIVLPFALIFLLRRNWRFIGGLAIAAGVLGVMSLAAVGLSGVVSYCTLLIDIFKRPSSPAYLVIKPWNMPTLRGFVSGVLGRHVQPLWVSGLAIVLSCSLILFAVRSWNRMCRGQVNDSSSQLMFAAALIISLVTSPHLYPHDLAPLALAITLIVASPSFVPKSAERLFMLAVIAVLYASPLYIAALVKKEFLWIVAPLLVGLALGTVALARRGMTQMVRDGLTSDDQLIPRADAVRIAS